MELLEGILHKILEEYPWALAVCLIAFALLFLVLLLKVIRGEQEVTVFRVIKFTPNKALETLKEQFDELNEHSELKSHVLKLMNQTVLTLSQWGDSLPDTEFEKKIRSLYEFVLPGLATLLTKHRNNSLRVAVFTEREEGLKILHGFGYSVEGKNKLTLSVGKSKAGYCYTHGEIYSNMDISTDPTYERNPKASKEYFSLVCVPIVYQNQVIGVLNVDGLNKNSFDRDDIDYIGYFANVLAPLLNMELKYNERLLKEAAI